MHATAHGSFRPILLALLACALLTGPAFAMGKTPPPPDYTVGVAGLSAAHWPNPSPNDWDSFWREVDDVASEFGVHSRWDESGVGVLPATIQYTLGTGRDPVVVIEVRDVIGDPTRRAALEGMLATLLQGHAIPYLGLGNEIDDATDFPALAQLIHELAAFVHSLGTGTEVVTVFQYERMLKRSDAATLVASVAGSLDAVGFTTYPFLTYTTTAKIPNGYFDPINVWTSKPILFTETGWPSRGNHPGYPTVKGSEGEQVAFIRKLRDKLVGKLELRLVNWAFVHDMEDWRETDPIDGVVHLFSSCGLMANTPGIAKPAYAEWQKLRNDSTATLTP